MKKNSAKLKISLLCGGPSLERGISLNSARSIMDHLSLEEIDIFPIYFDIEKNAYKISKNQLYSNTPSDFDFKLSESGVMLGEKDLIKELKKTDITFPVMHGPFGEDGKIQSFLEKNNIPFIGSGSSVCKNAFDKFRANKFLKENNFFTLPSAVLKIYHKNHKKIIENFFMENNISRAIVKPASGGSSIGVFSVSSPKEAMQAKNTLFSKRMDTRVVVEPFASGIEFTMIILKNKLGIPVALLPTEIETDYTENQFFDFRKKYLPTRQVRWHCPPRFGKDIIEKIQAQGEQIFNLFKMNDFARFDGWVLPSGDVWFCDFNPISGMEQNSFLFQQSSLIGMTHEDVLRYIVETSCVRQKINFPQKRNVKNEKNRRKVSIVMGGSNSERQVSLMSGTNVWLKLRKSKKYKPEVFLIDDFEKIWKVPYHLCLNHTVEEVRENCEKYLNIEKELSGFKKRARLRLSLSEEEKSKEFCFPFKVDYEKFLSSSNFVFIALHGGSGEDGTWQSILEKKGIKFNGPNKEVSRLCIDKSKTAQSINNLNMTGVSAIPGKKIDSQEIFSYNKDQVHNLWKKIKKEFNSRTLIIKPLDDGCTTGIARIFSSKDLFTYIDCLKKGISFLEKGTLSNQKEIIEMPVKTPSHLLIEKFIETDILRVAKNKLKHKRKTNLIEITIGVLKEKRKNDYQIKALNPSITISQGDVLTVEEKFQGGTGVNITPPPESIVSSKILSKTKQRIKKLAEKMNIRGYSRIDAFLNIKNGNLLVIEINTLPGLTPSTVLYHQGLAEKPPLTPLLMLEKIIDQD